MLFSIFLWFGEKPFPQVETNVAGSANIYALKLDVCKKSSNKGLANIRKSFFFFSGKIAMVEIKNSDIKMR